MSEVNKCVKKRSRRKELNEEQKTTLEKIPTNARGVYKRACLGNSKAAAIKAFCIQCYGWVACVQEIRTCLSPACPLYPYRPYQNSDVLDEEIETQNIESEHG